MYILCEHSVKLLPKYQIIKCSIGRNNQTNKYINDKTINEKENKTNTEKLKIKIKSINMKYYKNK